MFSCTCIYFEEILSPATNSACIEQIIRANTVGGASISYDPLYQDQNHPIWQWKSLIRTVCDWWDLNNLEFSECIKRARWKYPILVRRIGRIEFDWAESYTFNAAYMYLICTYFTLRCKLEGNVNKRMMISPCCISTKPFLTFQDIITFNAIVWFWEVMLS